MNPTGAGLSKAAQKGNAALPCRAQLHSRHRPVMFHDTSTDASPPPPRFRKDAAIRVGNAACDMSANHDQRTATRHGNAEDRPVLRF